MKHLWLSQHHQAGNHVHEHHKGRLSRREIQSHGHASPSIQSTHIDILKGPQAVNKRASLQQPPAGLTSRTSQHHLCFVEQGRTPLQACSAGCWRLLEERWLARVWTLYSEYSILTLDYVMWRQKKRSYNLALGDRRSALSAPFSIFQHGKLRSRLPKCNGRRMSSLQGELAAYQQPPTKAPWHLGVTRSRFSKLSQWFPSRWPGFRVGCELLHNTHRMWCLRVWYLIHLNSIQ